MLQFAKRLSAHGARCTLAATRFILASTPPEPGPVRVVPISDGCDRAGFAEVDSVPAYLDRLESACSASLADLLRSESAAGRPVRVLVYDAFLPWARPVAQGLGAAAAAFFTQACAVDAVYAHVWEGRVGIPVPVQQGPVRLPGLPPLEPEDLPSFMLGPGDYPAYLELVMNQFQGLRDADDVFINSFYELEPQEAEYMESTWGAKTIGPTVPSAYVDNRVPDDTSYGFSLYSLAATTASRCGLFLASHPPHSVVYVSFGSMASLSPIQLFELAHGLLRCGKPFLWVVRASERPKIPAELLAEEEGAKKQLYTIVEWAPQLEVLAQEAVGCFVTHCGWNSTVEAIALGKPMVGMPQWTDQPTNAKYVEGVWGVGVRARAGAEDGVVGREEVERCVRQVMEGESGEGYRRRAAEWRRKACEAVTDGGSSDRNIAEFVTKYAAVDGGGAK
ncbi:UDP-glycosyltransferase 74F2 [Ananas comosus]|uniref:Glycosyltransferase n=1 Tax=Ananas comosus TaxID=4615 RepID=A0A199UTN9_ANACO|nr:UDP-glycosyltransferase 74F2 [Ananas comosus]